MHFTVYSVELCPTQHLGRYLRGVGVSSDVGSKAAEMCCVPMTPDKRNMNEIFVSSSVFFF